jgi:hypothetical protein
VTRYAVRWASVAADDLTRIIDYIAAENPINALKVERGQCGPGPGAQRLQLAEGHDRMPSDLPSSAMTWAAVFHSFME